MPLSLNHFQFCFICKKIMDKNASYIYLNMLRKRSDSKSAIEIQPSLTPVTKCKTPVIILPSAKPNSILSNSEPSPSKRRTQLQTSNAMFDPNSASPANEFMQTLKQRMSVYYEQEVSMFPLNTFDTK